MDDIQQKADAPATVRERTGYFDIYLPDPQYDSPAAICKRPGLNMTGKGIQLLVNAYPITSFPTKNVQQYDVSAVLV